MASEDLVVLEDPLGAELGDLAVLEPHRVQPARRRGRGPRATVTPAPASWSSSAAARPAKPAPTTTTSTSSHGEPSPCERRIPCATQGPTADREAASIRVGSRMTQTSRRLRARPTESRGASCEAGAAPSGPPEPGRHPGRLRPPGIGSLSPARPGHPGAARRGRTTHSCCPCTRTRSPTDTPIERNATLHVYNWADYLWPKMFREFEDRYSNYGVTVELTTFNDISDGHPEDDLGTGRGGRVLPGSVVDLAARDRRAPPAAHARADPEPDAATGPTSRTPSTTASGATRCRTRSTRRASRTDATTSPTRGPLDEQPLRHPVGPRVPGEGHRSTTTSARRSGWRCSATASSDVNTGDAGRDRHGEGRHPRPHRPDERPADDQRHLREDAAGRVLGRQLVVGRHRRRLRVQPAEGHSPDRSSGSGTRRAAAG